MNNTPLWQPGDPPVGLYVHVPFCRAICTYCAFAKGEYAADRAERWLDALEREVAVRGASTWAGRPLLDTVFLGGGTPSALAEDQWARLGSILRGGFDLRPRAEFTSEANPESLTPGICEAMRRVGVNRVSLGVQSQDAAELALLGRIHGTDEVKRAVRAAREAGFDNLNLDLMYGLPGQAPETFRDSLAATLDLGPDHLSAYCLGLEPGTALAEDVARGTVPSPRDETAREQYEILVRTTQEQGFELYEISNFAHPERACRHNIRYWRRQDVIGIGPSSHALLGQRRWVNPAPLEKWDAAYSGGAAGPEPRPVPEEMARFEWIFLRLRLAEGLNRTEFESVWGRPFDELYGETLAELAAGGMLESTGDVVRLTPVARFLSDAVFSEFAPD